jgi:threonyl-tRNA synthetase
MAQDDAHVFCEPEQVDAELDAFFALTAEVYEALAIDGVEVSVATRPESGFAGDIADWEAAEAMLIGAVERAGFPGVTKPGEAAFYGPKVECDFQDVLGRPWTLSTLQLDVSMPARFELGYVGRDGGMHRPAMLHRAVLGSLERFIALYIEMTGGNFPLWLAPLQVSLLPIADRHAAYAARAAERLAAAGIRVAVDERNEKLGFKVREAEMKKVPLMLVVGDQEEENGTVSPRWHGSRRASEAVPIDALVERLAADIAARRDIRPGEGGVASG